LHVFAPTLHFRFTRLRMRGDTPTVSVARLHLHSKGSAAHGANPQGFVAIGQSLRVTRRIL
jgi:hypothetical protein